VRIVEGHRAGVTGALFGPDGRRAVSADAEGTIRFWHLDWEPGVERISEWDEGVRPYLEIFLVLHTPYAGNGPSRSGRPRWRREEMEAFLAGLSRRGYGWLRPEAVERRLKKMASGWGGRTTMKRGLPEGEGKRPLIQHPVIRFLLPAIGGIRSRISSVLANPASLAFVGLLLPVLLFFSYLSLRGMGDPVTGSFNGVCRVEYRVQYRLNRELLLSMQRSSYLKGPVFLDTDAETCAGIPLARQIEEFMYPEDSGDLRGKPGGSMRAPKIYMRALSCLRTRRNGDLVGVFLDLLQEGAFPEKYGDSLSIIVQNADLAFDQVVAALADVDPSIRHAAAYTLAYMDEERAWGVLLESLAPGDLYAREAGSWVLRELIGAGRISDEAASSLIQELSKNGDPQLRRNAVYVMEALEGGEHLLEKVLEEDEDGLVRQAAERALKRMERLDRWKIYRSERQLEVVVSVDMGYDFRTNPPVSTPSL
ncbi:MAG: hypothetical protein JW821_03595, partial [Deltaproteobacteria bacterium]|nr:hypothetical protein [Deltaproteobacteria bacterium]